MSTVTMGMRRTLVARATRLAAWSTRDGGCALAWMAAAIAARALLVGRIEGALDHDLSVVGLMALDIAAGRRWPVFFDGKRYMGALESYTAASFVAAFGHSPIVVALATGPGGLGFLAGAGLLPEPALADRLPDAGARLDAGPARGRAAPRARPGGRVVRLGAGAVGLGDSGRVDDLRAGGMLPRRLP